MRKKRSDTLNTRVGTIGKNNNGSVMEVLEYNNCSDVYVKFEKGNLVHTNWLDFTKGLVRNPYDKTVYKIGFLGEGMHKPSNNCKTTKQYKSWQRMFMRCYDLSYQERNPTYKGCLVSEEWHNFQNFAAWYDKNYYEIEGEETHLDKDILIKGNKVYSPETCVFVPKRINSLFIKSATNTGELPTGVSLVSKTQKYRAQCDKNGKREFLGEYRTPKEAFLAYKSYKEELIKQIANDYKDKIPNNLYESMLKYTI